MTGEKVAMDIRVDEFCADRVDAIYEVTKPYYRRIEEGDAPGNRPPDHACQRRRL
jgi:hypothetical protein